MPTRLLLIFVSILLSNSCGGGDKLLPSSNPPEYNIKKVYTAPVSSSSQAAVPPVKPAEPEQPLIELPSLEPGPNEKGAWRKVPLKRVPRRGFRLNTGPLPNWEPCTHRSSWGVYAGKIPLYPHRLLAYYNPMLPPERTLRRRIMELLTDTRLTTHQLAQMLGIPERQVEDHLVHVVKSITRDKTSRFVLEPSRCQDCDFIFRGRRRLTRPSRCPECRSESIAAPRYGINSVGSQSGRVDSNVRGR